MMEHHFGSIECEECRIDSLSQSWSVISCAGDEEKKNIAMEAVMNQLVDNENKIVKLLTPAFDKSKLEPGYIKAYSPGIRENGGQYTHASIWVIIALSKLGLGEKAHELFKMINPIEHSKTEEEANKYKVEPYVVAADVYSEDSMVGRGGWTWYTGSSSWLYKAGIENILGLKKEGEKFKIEPCIPSDWEEYSIKYKYKQTLYNIEVKNPDHKNIGTKEVNLDGKILENKWINLVDDNNIHKVDIIM